MERISKTPRKVIFIPHVANSPIVLDFRYEIRHLTRSHPLLHGNGGPDFSRAHLVRMTWSMKRYWRLSPVAIEQFVGISPDRSLLSVDIPDQSRLSDDIPDPLEICGLSGVPVLRLHRPYTAPTHRKGCQARDGSGTQTINIFASFLLQILESSPHHFRNEPSIPVVGGNNQIIGVYP